MFLQWLALACVSPVLGEVGQVLTPGYPGYVQPQVAGLPRQAEGRALHYRHTPEVDRLRSPVHELYMRPYNYANTEQSAVAVLVGDSVTGTLHFSQTGGPTSPVRVYGNITGLSPGHHGFHIHQYGDTTQGCGSMGGHYNPLQLRHGAPDDHYRHIGDLGNILAGEDGVARVEIRDRQLSLNGLSSIIGRGLVVHSGEDDLGKGGDAGSLKTGNAGSRVSCAVIARAAVRSV